MCQSSEKYLTRIAHDSLFPHQVTRMLVLLYDSLDRVHSLHELLHRRAKAQSDEVMAWRLEEISSFGPEGANREDA